MSYVLIRSWHVVLTPTRMFDTYRTRCGRTVVTKDTRDDLPMGERSCETCLRLAVRAEESPANDEVGE
jgi:hypothetical protein